MPARSAPPIHPLSLLDALKSKSVASAGPGKRRYPAGQEHKLRAYLEGKARFLIERAYGEIMLATATPARMRRLEQVLANEGHIAALARQRRAEVDAPSRG